jgi:hypothetical protein
MILMILVIFKMMQLAKRIATILNIYFFWFELGSATPKKTSGRTNPCLAERSLRPLVDWLSFVFLFRLSFSAGPAMTRKPSSVYSVNQFIQPVQFIQLFNYSVIQLLILPTDPRLTIFRAYHVIRLRTGLHEIET